MLSFIEMLQVAIDNDASDVFIVAGQPLSYKKGKSIYTMEEEKVMPATSRALVQEAYQIANRDIAILDQAGDDDFAISVPNMARLRMCTFKQRGSLGAVLRVVSFGIPDYQKLSIPEDVMNLSATQKGMILVTGTAGSGKSTTLACIIDRINHNRSGHIITLEDPIEYLHRNKKSIVSQREIAIDTVDYLAALRACLRQAPDVILLGEMRDAETIRTAMTAAETGHTLIATLHTKGAVNTIDRIVDSFPSTQQMQIRVQLAEVLRTVVSQQLLPDVNGGLVPAYEIMHMTGAIRSLIRDNKGHQIDNAIAAGARDGMISMDQSILALYREGKISKETALEYADNPEQLRRSIG